MLNISFRDNKTVFFTNYFNNSCFLIIMLPVDHRCLIKNLVVSVLSYKITFEYSLAELISSSLQEYYKVVLEGDEVMQC